MGKENLADAIIRTMLEAEFQQPIIENNLRGVFAEYLVAHFMGAGWTVKSGSWNEWDIDGPAGEKLEVKCSSYLQTWTEEARLHSNIKPSLPSFDIAERTRGYWLEVLPKPIRPADAYVFVLHAERDPAMADQRKPEQWRFYVVASSDLPERQKKISLGPLSRLAEPVMADELKAEVARVLEGVRK